MHPRRSPRAAPCRVRTSPPRRSSRSPVVRPHRSQSRSPNRSLLPKLFGQNPSRNQPLRLRGSPNRLARTSLRKLAPRSRPWELPAAAKRQRPRSFRPLPRRHRHSPDRLARRAPADTSRPNRRAQHRLLASSPASHRDRTARTPPRPPPARLVTTLRSCLPSSSARPADLARLLRQEQAVQARQPVQEQRVLATRHLPQGPVLAPALARLQVRVQAAQREPAGPRLQPPRFANAPRRSPTRQRGWSL